MCRHQPALPKLRSKSTFYSFVSDDAHLPFESLIYLFVYRYKFSNLLAILRDPTLYKYVEDEVIAWFKKIQSENKRDVKSMIGRLVFASAFLPFSLPDSIVIFLQHSFGQRVRIGQLFFFVWTVAVTSHSAVYLRPLEKNAWFRHE